MIKLFLSDKPQELTQEIERNLIEDYKNNPKNDPVWSRFWIKEAVFGLSNGKCAYSEVKLKEEGKDMQIDHFYPKSLYPDKVIEWGNLLPSLNHCNRSKGKTDPNSKPLVNPLVDDPKEFFSFKNGYLLSKNSKGRNTIEALKLNDHLQLNVPRAQLLMEINNNLNDISYSLDKVINYFVKRLKEIMDKGNRRNAYSAAVSTFILSNENYLKYKEELVNHNLWDEDFINMESELIFSSLI